MAHVGQKQALGLGCGFGGLLGFMQRRFAGEQFFGGLHALDESPGPARQQADEFQIGRIEVAIAPLRRGEGEGAEYLAIDPNRHANVGGELEFPEAGMARVWRVGRIGNGEQIILRQRCAAIGSAKRENLTVRQRAGGRYLNDDL